jgi:hypothetical protein
MYASSASSRGHHVWSSYSILELSDHHALAHEGLLKLTSAFSSRMHIPFALYVSHSQIRDEFAIGAHPGAYT